MFENYEIWLLIFLAAIGFAFLKKESDERKKESDERKKESDERIDELKKESDERIDELKKESNELKKESNELKKELDDSNSVLPKRYYRNTMLASVLILRKKEQQTEDTLRNRTVIKGKGKRTKIPIVVEPCGIGFFISNNAVFTAAHNIAIGAAVGDGVVCRIHSGENDELLDVSFQISYIDRLDERDICVLKYEGRHSNFLQPFDGEINEINEKDYCLTTFRIATHGQDKRFPICFGVIPCVMSKRSEHHFLYSTNAFSGDSGAAIVLKKCGHVVGIHIETVNEACEKIEASQIDNDTVAASINSLVSGFSQGFVGLRLDSTDMKQIIRNAAAATA